MEEPMEWEYTYEERGDTHKRPEGVANLGYFESEIDGKVTKQYANNVCVLVINYLTINCPVCIQNGVGSCDPNNSKKCIRKVEDKPDVEKLRTLFVTNRNCNFRDLSPNKNDLLQLLGDEKKILQLFNSQDDVPSVFVLFILAHGYEDGKIWICHSDSETNDQYFTTDDVFDSLKRLQSFDKCLKIVNIGPCRGKLNDSKFDIEKSHEDYDNRNSCRITTRPGMHNYVVCYSTVERTKAYGWDDNSAYFFHSICTCFDNLHNDEPLLKFFTNVQNHMHKWFCDNWNKGENTDIGQTPELKMFTQDRKFIISKAKIPTSNTDASRGASNVSNVYFSWKSDEGHEIRGRRGFILSVVKSEKVKEMKKILRDLDFEITDWTLSDQSMGFYFQQVSQLEPDVGCILTCLFGPVCENDKKEVCVRVGQEARPITDILHSLVGPKNDKWIGKPKILFVVNVEAPETPYIHVEIKDLQVSATNHSGWLVLILKCEDALEKFIQLFGKIDEKISLQELLEPLLTRESKREDVVLLNSTLQYLVKFPNCPRAFVEPDFKLKETQIPPDEMDSSKSSMKSDKEPTDFVKVKEETIRYMVENKKSIANRRENSQTSSDFESYPIIDSARPSDTGIVWLFNSVAGAGKSTVLKEMRYQLTKNDGRRKIDLGFEILLIPLNDKYQNTNEVDEIKFLEETTSNSKEDINNWIEKGEVIVCLDGFDEVCPDFRETILKVVIALNNARVPLFIGTRPHEVHHIQDRIKNSTIVEIQPLDEAKQIKFLKTVARKNQLEIEQLRKNFRDHQDILGNPRYLKLLADYKGDGNLYEIFDEIVYKLVKNGLEKENEGIEVAEKEIKRILKIIQLMASRFVRAIDQGSVAKEDLKKIIAVGIVSYCNKTVIFSYQSIAKFLTAQKFIDDLKIQGTEKEPLFNDEFVQCRKFVDLFFSTEKGKNANYAQAFVDCAKPTNDLELVRKICGENLKQMFNLLNPDLSLKDKDGKNALHFALRHLEMAKMVHEKNNKLVAETTKNGENCLHLAIDDEKCSEEVAIWLLQNTEVDKNAETRFGDTPLLLACEKQKWEVAKKLFCSVVEVNKQDRTKKTILHYAVHSNNIDLVQGLLDKGSDVKLKDKYGATALHIAAQRNETPATVDILLIKDAEVVHSQDGEYRTALHYAAENNQSAEVVHKLLDKKADIDSQDRKGITALHLAAGWNKNPEISNVLLEKGAQVNAQDKEKQTALHYATKNNQVAKVIQKLLEKGVEVNSEDQEGRTALHLAAWWNNDPEILQILIDNGAGVNAKDNYDWTALHYAARFNPNPEVVQMLLDNGAEINAENDDEENALFLADKYNPVKEVSQKLLDLGAEVNEMINSD